jgi:hypothetical protein
MRPSASPIFLLPEIPKPGKLSPRSLAFVLNVVLIDLQPLLSKGNQDLVPNGDAGFCVTADVAAVSQTRGTLVGSDVSGERRLGGGWSFLSDRRGSVSGFTTRTRPS